MNPAQLLEHFDRISEAPDAVARLRRFILDLAVRGKLLEHSANWYEMTLGEIGEWGSGGTPSKSHTEYYGGDIPWLVIGDLNEGLITCAETYITEVGLKNSSAKIVEPGTVLIAMYGSIGKLGIAGIRCATNQAIAFCVPDLAKVSREFLVVVLKSLREELLEKGHGVAQQNISQKILKAHPVKLPPLAEQHRIVAKVDELMALCDQLEAANNEREARRDRLVAASLHRIGTAAPATDEAATKIQSATPLRDAARFHLDHLPRLTTRPEHIKQLRQTILNLAVRGRLISQDPNDEPAAGLLKRIESEVGPKLNAATKNLPCALPEGWIWTCLGKLIVHSDAGWSPKTESHPRSGFEWGVLKVSAVSWDTFRPWENKQVLPGTEPKLQAQVKSGDFLISRANTAELIARAVIVDEEPINLMMSDKVVRLRLAMPCDCRYVWIVNNYADFAREHYVRHASGVSPSMKNISRNVIMDLPFPLPPLAEQHRIVAKVDELMALCDQLEAQLTTTQADSRRLIEAVLHESLAEVASFQ